ncbi:probable G-protein coupled receptor 116 [Stegastes partitus]|uniref:Probable G-protein coupled receptor 116 n=1 Tax=Stegastes partitus TaxID=144197 RepID=A0A9Y4NS86_9TELE|nr:PREDICTED: probable G-protein coupled receptor 116 [Stegastes partitus]
MTLPKTVGYVAVLLVICISLENWRYRQPLNVVFQEPSSSETSPIHIREKRETSVNSTDHEVQVVISISDLDSIKLILANLMFPLRIDNSTEIVSIETTTVCSVNTTGYQCRCEESFAWPLNSCIDHGACDSIIDDTCGCINGLPVDGQYCQSNTSQTVTTPTTTTTTSNDPKYQ